MLLLNWFRYLCDCCRRRRHRTRTDKLAALFSVRKEAERFGLLFGVDPEKDDFYASEIAMTHQSLAWLETPGIFWDVVTQEAAERDSSPEEYLKYLLTNFDDNFFHAKALYGREEELKYLTDIMKWRGEIAFVIGAESTGKTLLLLKLRDIYNDGLLYTEENEQQRMVLHVDARIYNNDLSKGFYTELTRLYKIFPVYETAPEGTNDPVALPCDEASYERERKAYRANWGSNDEASLGKLGIAATYDVTAESSAIDLIFNFKKFAEFHGRVPILIFDHADDALLSGALDDRIFFETITHLAQQRKMNVIISTRTRWNIHARLKDHLPCYADLKNTVLTGDLSPKQTWDLLVNAVYNVGTADNPNQVKTIGMGRRLAELLLSAYGGHLLYIRNAILALTTEKENFTVLKTIRDLTFNTVACLGTEESRKMLTAMAQCGAFKQQTLLEKIEKIRAENVGCRVSSNCCTQHVPEAAYCNGPGDYEVLLASPVHVQRLAVAWTLNHSSSPQS